MAKNRPRMLDSKLSTTGRNRKLDPNAKKHRCSARQRCSWQNESQQGAQATNQKSNYRCQKVVHVRYRDHVLYHRVDPSVLSPQIREAVGWLVHEEASYIILAWDRDAGPSTLKGGDPKASGLVLLRCDILEMRKLA